jgi:Zn-dependent M28 family amino/carboxypeptidase
MLVRITSIVLTVTLLVALAGLYVAGEAGAELSSAVVVCSIAAAIASLPLVICFTGNRSAGAADNASGVITLLITARMLLARPDLGVIITSGEELGLAGARFFVESQENASLALNCDTIDDNGRFVCMTRGKRGLVAAAIARAARELGLDVRVRSLLPGILADSMAFTDAGWDSVTLSRGNIATLARVHTSRDTAAAMTGTGIAKAARLLAATLEELN